MLRIPTTDQAFYLKETAIHKVIGQAMAEKAEGREVMQIGLFPCCMSAENHRLFGSVT